MLMPYLLFGTVFLFSFSDAKMAESYVRVQPMPDGTKNVLLMEGVIIVNFHLNSTGEILDCDAYKRNQVMVGLIEIEKEELSGGYNVQYLMQDLDVAWYGRQCSRWLKHKRRENDRSDPINANWLDAYHAREKPWPGTKFCTTKTTTFNPKLDWPGISETDKCCQDLHKCPATLAPNHFLFGLLNIFQHRMFQCECLEYFKECLEDVGDEESKEISRVFFEATDMKCFKKERHDICEEYKLPWFDECLESEVGYVNYVEELRNM